MKKVLFLFIAIFLFANQPIFNLNTKGHTGLIRDIIVYNNEIISASNDKTIRIYDIKTGKEKREILTQFGNGSYGKIFAIALSKNGKYLAVGGYFGNDDANNLGDIKIYDYKSAKLLKVLKSHIDVITDLSFSSNGKYLISGSWDTTAKIWNINDFTLLDTIKSHTKAVLGVEIIQNRYAVTVGWDNKIDIYDIKKHHSIKFKQLKHKLQFIAINKVKKHIAVCGNDNQINIFDYQLKHIKTIFANYKLTGINYSKDGKYLIVGGGSYPFNINIYETKNYSLYNTFTKHTNTVMAVDFINNRLVVSGGGNEKEIYIWNFHTGDIFKKIVGQGATIWGVGIKGNNIAWGNIWSADNGMSTLDKSINLKTFEISNNVNDFHRISTINGNYKLIATKGGDYGYKDAVLNIVKNGKIVDYIIKDAYNGYRHICYGWYKDYIVSGGDNGILKIFDIHGNEILSLVGHTGTIWSIALEGDILISGGIDQTIKVWDLSQIGYKSIIYPILTIFISKNNDYLIWSNKGYFASSINGRKFAEFWINQGYNKEMKYVRNKYLNTFYKPDIIRNIWLKNRKNKKRIKNEINF